MNIIVGVIFIIVVIFAILSNKDLFSPGKFFLVSFFSFHIGGLFGEYPVELWAIVLMVLLVGAMVVVFEASRSVSVSQTSFAMSSREDIYEGRIFLLLWMLSIPAIASQIYMLQIFGGLEGLINSIALRVVEWRGLGWAKTLIALLMPINLAYFAIGLIRPRTSNWWVLYGIHFIIFIIAGLLSGSRSGLLNIFAFQCFIYHYLKRPVGIRFALLLGVFLIVVAAIMGVIRNYIKIDGDDFTTGIDLSDLKTIVSLNGFYYGIEPLEILLKADFFPLAYGGTFLSILTNVVPRPWWPEKPETGGIFFTKEYAGDAWDGYSNLTPTFLGEFVINFGWTLGLFLFMIIYPTIMYFLVKKYLRLMRRMHSAKSPLIAVDLVMYLCTMWTMVALMTAEVTNVILGFFLTQYIPLAMIAQFSSQRYMQKSTTTRQ